MLKYILLKVGVLNFQRCKTREEGKDTYLKSLNKDSINRSKGLPKHFRKFDAEIKEIQKKIVALDEYSDIVASVPKDKTYNKIGSAINRILCYYENKILHHAIDFITKKNIEIAVLMFDGLMIYGDYYNDTKLLTDITNYVEIKMHFF